MAMQDLERYTVKGVASASGEDAKISLMNCLPHLENGDELSGQEHSLERDRKAVTYHYDTGNDFYRLFLGNWMAYSCAYFDSPESKI
jgi:hypothetical protein